MKLLTKEQQKSYENAKICYVCQEKFGDKYAKDEKYRKVRDHCHYTGEYRGAAHSICNLKFSVPEETEYYLTRKTLKFNSLAANTFIFILF